ncbi:MAG: hypothetical protein ACM3ZE_17280 [Myxococcales bacterium]
MPLFLLVAATTCVGCRRCDATNQHKNSAGSVASSTGTTIGSSVALTLPKLVPLHATSRVESLTGPGHPETTLLLPIGTTDPKPMVVILLPPNPVSIGARCEELGRSTADSAFVLCQASRSAEQSKAPAAWDEVDASLRAAVRDVKSKYGDYVQSKELTMVGLGEAAELAVPIVRRAPEFFPRVALLNGGLKAWTNVDSARFAAGAKAFLAHCSQPSCRADAKRVIVTLKNAGVATRLELDPPLSGVAGMAQHPPPTHELLRWLLSAERS